MKGIPAVAVLANSHQSWQSQHLEHFGTNVFFSKNGWFWWEVLTQLCAGITNCKYLSQFCTFQNNFFFASCVLIGHHGGGGGGCHCRSCGDGRVTVEVKEICVNTIWTRSHDDFGLWINLKKFRLQLQVEPPYQHPPPWHTTISPLYRGDLFYDNNNDG